MPNFPAKVHGATGGLEFKGNPIICGGIQNGSHSNKCYSLKNNEWVSSVNMNSIRAEAAAAQLQDGKLLIIGGSNTSVGLNSAEILTEKGWESNIPSLPVTFQGHCIVTVNATTVLVIGGYQSVYSGKAFYFTFGEESWTKAPELKYKRGYHSCGRIRKDTGSIEMSIIVAGGYDVSSLSSVELLDIGSNEWKIGPELPFAIYRSQMVGDQNGGVVLIGGESSSIAYLDTIFQLPHGGPDAEWNKMDQKLLTGRSWHTAFLVPDSIVDCS
jgi:hypothetical protein